MSKKSKFLSVNVMFFFGACIILFLINQLYSVLQVSLIMKSTGSILLLSTVMTAMVLPRIFILPVSGILTDKMGIFKTLVGGTGLLGVLLFSLLLVNRMNLMNKNGILLFAVLFGAISAALLPALYAAVPSLVCGEHLQKANSVMQFINQGSMLAGPLVAGIIVEKMSGQAYPVMAVSAVIAGFLFFRVKYIGKKEQEGRAEETEAPSQGSFCHLFQQPVLILLLVFTAVLNLCMIGPQQVGFPVIAIQHLSEGVDGYTKLLSITGLGALISAVLAGSMKRRQNGKSIRLILWCAIALGIVWGTFSFSSFEPLILGAIFAAGLLLGFINVLFTTIIQQLTPDFLVGRVMSIQFLCSTGLQPVSYMITGTVLDQCSIQNLYLISGGMIVLISILILVYSRKQTGLQMQISS